MEARGMEQLLGRQGRVAPKEPLADEGARNKQVDCSRMGAMAGWAAAAGPADAAAE